MHNLIMKKHFNILNSCFHQKISAVITDMHPNYFATQFGQKLAAEVQADLYALQHHIAHFYAILGEHNLLESDDKNLRHNLGWNRIRR